MDESVKNPAIPDQQNGSYVEAEVLPEGYSGAASEDVGKMYEAVAAVAITDEHNEEYSEAEEIPEGASGAPEDLRVDTSVCPEKNKYQDAKAIAHPEVPEYVLEDNENPVEGSRYEVNTHNTLEYDRKLDLDVTNIDKYDKHTWRTIYEEIDAPYSGQVKLFPRSFINRCKNHPNETQTFQLISRIIFLKKHQKEFYMRRWLGFIVK